MTTHRIKRLSINANVAQHADALDMRRQLTQQYQAVLSLFEPLFEQLDTHGDFVHIPKLHVKLTLQNDYDLNALLEQLTNTLLQLKQSLQSGGDLSSVFANTNSGSSISVGEELRNSLINTSEQEQSILHWQPLDIVTYYLTTGSLPWFVVHNEGIKQQMQQWSLEHSQPSLQEWLVSTGMKKNNCLLRWLQLLPLTALQAQVEQLLSLGSMPISTEQMVLTHLLNKQLPTRNHQQLLTLLAVLINTIFHNHDLKENNNHHVLNQDYRLSNQQQAQWLSVWQQHKLDVNELTSLLTNINAIPNNSSSTQAENTLTFPSATAIEKPTSNISKLKAENEPTLTPIQLAGGILLYPYLKRLFAACNINTESFAKQVSHRNKAASLIYFLITGNTQAQEYELGMIKVLLGLSESSLLIVTSDQLSSNDISEAHKTLNTLINHWDKLKKTSIEGLRNSFLTRPGYLQVEHDMITLKLERLGLDILLDFLPFPLTVISLPWIPTPIQVDWS